MDYVKANPSPYSVAQFVEWYRNGSLDLNPKFQRRSVWKKGAKAFLIDTMLRGFPIPPIYLRALPSDQSTFKTRKQVVDGQQRLRTVIAFVAQNVLENYKPAVDEFTLSGAHNEDHSGSRFKELSDSERQYLLDYEFSVYTFDSQTGDDTILQIFSRMNSTGVRLNAQELRNAEYFGYFKSLSFGLAANQLRRWIDWRIFTLARIARMDEVEYTSDLLGLMLNGVTAKTPKIIDELYAKFDNRFPERKEARRRFEHIFDAIDDAMPQTGLGTASKKTAFYALFATAYDYCFGLRTSLASRQKPRKLPSKWLAHLIERIEGIAAGSAPQSVIDASTVRVTHASARERLVKYLLAP